ncbi:hypothetical protein MWU59_11040 [Flavobacteriaceae bacterium F08102]|nr:hypothetical protein [Flavobacteriaceae bacterium F08102]
MRKHVIGVALVAIVAFSFTSCKKDTKDQVKTEEVTSETGKEIAENVLYQCPMDCEDGKSYTEKGNCPVCKMSLKAKEVDMDGAEEHESDGDESAGHDSKESSEHN